MAPYRLNFPCFVGHNNPLELKSLILSNVDHPTVSFPNVFLLALVVPNGLASTKTKYNKVELQKVSKLYIMSFF